MAAELRSKYGLEFSEYSRMLVERSGRCDICAAPFRGPKEPAVDHCHLSYVVRGLLCQKCNRAIGLLGDRPDLLRAAAAYIQPTATFRLRIA